MADQNRNNSSLGFNPAGLGIGMGIGLCFGTAMGNMGLGLCLGMGVGLCYSVALGHRSSSNDKPEEKTEEERKE